MSAPLTPAPHRVRLYSTRHCGSCRRAKAMLSARGVDVEEIDLTHAHDLRAQISDQTGWRTVPMIFVGDHFIGGYDDLLELEADGELDLVLGLSEK